MQGNRTLTIGHLRIGSRDVRLPMATDTQCDQVFL